ncbi:MAG: GNAT family N-acetyltransferase, partial [Gammaproteobacteria bacterium]|nr:GNAT family N-acetyltransferase [Gammaproteobacteria bacterium]
MAKLVSDNFEIPQEHNQPEFILRRLSIQYLELDYEAVMSSKNHLRQVFAANDDWPSDDMTLENNRQDLLWHDDEFERRSSFTYTVLTPNEKKCLGCVYIFAPTMDNFDAEVY